MHALLTCFLLPAVWGLIVWVGHHFLGFDPIAASILLVGGFMFMKENR